MPLQFKKTRRLLPRFRRIKMAFPHVKETQRLHAAIMREDLDLMKEILSSNITVKPRTFRYAMKHEKLQALWLLLELRPQPLEPLIEYAISLKNLHLVERLFTLYDGEKYKYMGECLNINYGACYTIFKDHCHDKGVLSTLLYFLEFIDPRHPYVREVLGVSEEQINNIVGREERRPYWRDLDVAFELYETGISSKYMREIVRTRESDPEVQERMITCLENELQFHPIPPLQSYYSLSDKKRKRWWEKGYDRNSFSFSSRLTHRTFLLRSTTIFFLNHIKPCWKGFSISSRANLWFLEWKDFSVPRVFLEEELKLLIFHQLTKNSKLWLIGELVLLQYRSYISRFLS